MRFGRSLGRLRLYLIGITGISSVLYLLEIICTVNRRKVSTLFDRLSKFETSEGVAAATMER